jgi:hypothetical protein
MQTMNQSLTALVVHGTITRETAISASASPGDLDLLLRKILGAAGGGRDEEGDAMAEPTSDFSKILKLQETRKHYEELQARHADEIAARDQEIAELRDQLAKSGGQSDERLAALEAENRQLAEQLRACRDEYEAKIERLNARLQSMKAKTVSEPGPEPQKRGFFRR